MKTHSLRLTIFVVGLLLNAALAWGAEKDAVVKITYDHRGCSGVCVSADGYILTAEHCVHSMKNSNITVLLNGKSYKAKIAHDPVRNYSDEASLLKIDTSDILPFLIISRTPPRIGDKVHSIGYPDGKYSESSGEIISISTKYISPAYDRFGRKVPGTAYATYVNFGVAKGNSGGPLFNESGEVIAISATTGPDGAGWIGLQSIRNTMRTIGPPKLRMEAKRTLYAYVTPGGT